MNLRDKFTEHYQISDEEIEEPEATLITVVEKEIEKRNIVSLPNHRRERALMRLQDDLKNNIEAIIEAY